MPEAELVSVVVPDRSIAPLASRTASPVLVRVDMLVRVTFFPWIRLLSLVSAVVCAPSSVRFSPARISPPWVLFNCLLTFSATSPAALRVPPLLFSFAAFTCAFCLAFSVPLFSSVASALDAVRVTFFPSILPWFLMDLPLAVRETSFSLLMMLPLLSTSPPTFRLTAAASPTRVPLLVKLPVVVTCSASVVAPMFPRLFSALAFITSRFSAKMRPLLSRLPTRSVWLLDAYSTPSFLSEPDAIVRSPVALTEPLFTKASFRVNCRVPFFARTLPPPLFMLPAVICTSPLWLITWVSEISEANGTSTPLTFTTKSPFFSVTTPSAMTLPLASSACSLPFRVYWPATLI
ncbi:hypothetical protein ENKOMM087B_13325 [Enterobacter kobei]|nr:Uncharacterised protein [Enterobacter kobei]